MRMRRKKNLESRLAEHADRMTNMQVSDRRFGVGDSQSVLDYAALFGNDRPVELEIGCGKGGFITAIAAAHPEINFLAVEKYANVLVSAMDLAQEKGITNVHFLWGDAEYLPRFLPAHSIRKLYLNFSTPFQKKSYAVHRLTHRHFLTMYRDLLTEHAPVVQKTDNRPFFQFSLEEFSQAGYTLQEVSLDLHADNIPDNIVTEYEQKFSEQGFPIYRVLATTP